jgi:hypothetical protein
MHKIRAATWEMTHTIFSLRWHAVQGPMPKWQVELPIPLSPLRIDLILPFLIFILCWFVQGDGKLWIKPHAFEKSQAGKLTHLVKKG